jgi:predicted metalloprotease with PDZ domain
VKFFSTRRVPLFLYFVIVLNLAPAARATIHYEVSLAHPEQHLFHVTMRIPNVDDHLVVRIPAWNALYQIRDFSAHIRGVEAFANESHEANTEPGSPAAMAKIDKQTWRIDALGTVTIRYDTYWDEPGPFAAQLNHEHAFINPAMILMYVPERRSEAVSIRLGDIPETWDAGGPGIIGSEAMGGARRFFGEFSNYDELADAPIEAGRLTIFQLAGLKPDIFVIVHGDHFKQKQLESELRRLCESEIRLMGGAPYARYTFILHLGKAALGAGGGMEHANSTAMSSSSAEYLPSLAAHEFFHLWNVKRIRPATLDPVDYVKEQYTRALWFAEGVTSTYASYTMVRTGLWTKQQFYHDLGEQITELEARPASRWQSVEQSSLDAWLEKYPLYETPEHSISYYTKGQILGVLLDILIRDRTANRRSLDDLLREMNQDFAVAGKTYRDSLDVQLLANKISGSSFEEFFKRYIAGAEPLPYRETFGLAGLELRETTRQRPALGFTAQTAGGVIVVDSVNSASPAGAAGLQTGDIVTKWNGGDPPRRSSYWLRQHKAGEPLHLRIRRDDAEMDLDFKLSETEEKSYDIAEDAHASEKARHTRDGLLQGSITAAASAQAAK